MISENDLKEIDSLGLEEKISRVNSLLENKENPKAFELALFVALKMAQEIKTGKELGSESGKIVAAWMQKYSAELVEETIPLAKQFFTNPEQIAARIREGLLKQDA